MHRGAAIGGAVGGSEAAAAAFREHWGRAVAALMRRFGDADLAEESVQEAFGRAAARWPADGVPASPLGWIVATAGNFAVDRLRRERALRERLPALHAEPAGSQPEAFEEDDAVPDERLELIFTCCHPALSAEASVALTLRLVAGLSTAEIARAFLVPEVAMAQRLVRAKSKIRMAGIPFGRPPGHLLADRLEHTAAVLYLVFNEGYSASSGDDLVRRDLCDESIRLARLLVSQLPAEPEARGLLALMLLHHARSAARTTAGGEMVLLEHQDRSRWDAAMIRSGAAELRRAERAGAPGPYQLQAAIAELHARAESFDATDWGRVAALYADLAAIAPSPVVDLNLAAAVSMADGPARGLELVDDLAASGALDRYHLLHAARADMLRRLGRPADALAAYTRALELAPGAAEREFLARRRAEMRRELVE
jgi:RNA polymerase sigma-70 factor (ECF subfamily)